MRIEFNVEPFRKEMYKEFAQTPATRPQAQEDFLALHHTQLEDSLKKWARKLTLPEVRQASKGKHTTRLERVIGRSVKRSAGKTPLNAGAARLAGLGVSNLFSKLARDKKLYQLVKFIELSPKGTDVDKHRLEIGSRLWNEYEGFWAHLPKARRWDAIGAAAQIIADHLPFFGAVYHKDNKTLVEYFKQANEESS